MKEKRITSIEIHNSANRPFCVDKIISERLKLNDAIKEYFF
ncbi:MAG: hypothetical protein AB9844_06805 [Clostridiaceae bacterium]